MIKRFAHAHFQAYSAYAGIVTINVGNGRYHELPVIDRYQGIEELHDFAHTNNLILVEISGFNGGRAVRDSGGDTDRRIVSPIAAARSFSHNHRKR